MLETKRTFVLIFITTLVIKLVIAATLPFTTDEAYFYIWGKSLELGYYDHPPMVGWILWLMEQVSTNEAWLRLPTILITSFIGWAIYRIVAEKNESLGLLSGSLYLVMPVNIYGVLISTDTSLILFSFLSVVAFYKAISTDKTSWLIISGLCLGFAVLSKYFSVFLGFAYLIYILIYARNLKGVRTLFIVYLFTLPAVILNLYWNYNHCWSNYMFNFVNRHEGHAGFSLATFFGYILMWVYLLVPPAIFYLYKNKASLLALSKTPQRVFLVTLFVPSALFLLLSLYKVIGLHWVFSFYPFAFIIAGYIFTEKQLVRSIQVAIVVSLLHVAALGALIISPTTFIKPDNKLYDDVIMGVYPDEFLEKISEYRGDYTLATISYGDAADMTYFSGENVSVIGAGSTHARHDDIVTDYRLLDGKNILIFTEKSEHLKGYERVFAEVDYRDVELHGAVIHLLIGQGFNYQLYRDLYLERVKHYYQIPDFLPKGKCYFYERYFPGQEY